MRRAWGKPALNRLGAGLIRPSLAELPETMLMHLRGPVEFALTRALRRVARLRPEVFDRLGDFRKAAFIIAPHELPVCFRLEPRGRSGVVHVVRPSDPRPCAVRISGPLATLLSLFDGSSDADAMFFARTIAVEGDTEAVVALHNALEAAELNLADIAGIAAPALRFAAELLEPRPRHDGLARA